MSNGSREICCSFVALRVEIVRFQLCEGAITDALSHTLSLSLEYDKLRMIAVSDRLVLHCPRVQTVYNIVTARAIVAVL